MALLGETPCRLVAIDLFRAVVFLGDAEVDELHRALVGDHDVRGLDVPMDHVLLMGGGEGIDELAHDRFAAVDGDDALVLHEVGQASAADVLEGDVVEFLPAARGDDAHDVGVGDSPVHVGLEVETPETALVVGHVPGEDLQRHVAEVADVQGEVDLSHGAGIDGPDHAEVVDEITGFEPGHDDVVSCSPTRRVYGAFPYLRP